MTKDERNRSVNSDAISDIEDEIEESNTEIITQPFDPMKIRVVSWEPTIELLMKRIQNNEIDLGPAFQRKGGIWSHANQSKLIESILIRIPLPSFYMDGTDEEKFLVVDGQQRLTALKNFIVDKTLVLEGLEFLPYNRKKFGELPRNMQRRIEETQVSVFLIEKGTPSGVKFNIFKRINTGGMPMSSQEIRHAMNEGPALDFLKDLAESSEFLAATQNSVTPDRMADRECALRFCAFSAIDIEKYNFKDLDSFLNETMQNLNKMNEINRKKLAIRFKRSMSTATKIFQKSAFRKLMNPVKGRNPFNKALFEAWSVNIDKLSDEEVKIAIRNKQRIHTLFVQLMENQDFEVSVTAGTGSPPKVRRRFSDIKKLLSEAIVC
jgi:Protein of unknown function DUF262